MQTLIDVNGNGLLRLAGINYELLGIAGQGGSSIVYKARKEGKAKKYIIKEFYPYDLAVGRNEDGSVCFADDMHDVLEKRKLRALRESKIVDILRHGNENNDPWFLDYGDPIHANNTLYTIIDTEAGEMLSEKINNGFFDDKAFVDICDCVLMILNALEPIHDKGYLHLDVSPDNIHVSDLNIMRMIDYNSAFPISGEPSEFLPSFKKGYAAPELKKAIDAGKLSFATDLFSVAAIFFELLIGRPPEENDWINRSRWRLTSEKGILKGASELLIKSTNSFLRKNLSNLPEIRLQSVAQMRDEIERLKKLCEVITLVNSPKRPNPNFVCREDEIENIGKFLDTDSYVILEGMGGIGKTELAKKYAWDNRDKYDAVQFITYSDNLMSTVALSLKFHNFDRAKEAEYQTLYGEEAIRYMYRDKVKCLKKRSDSSPCLIIVDNYNVQADDDFAEFVSGEYKVIFTSRSKHGGSVLEITELKDGSHLLELFRKYYAPIKLSVENEPIVMDIIRLLLGHTMTVMLIATAMADSYKTPSEMLVLVKQNLVPNLTTKILANKEEMKYDVKEQIISSHLTNLFDLANIRANPEFAKIMVNMSIISYSGIRIRDFYHGIMMDKNLGDGNEWIDKYKEITENPDYTDINRLIRLRWIQLNTESNYISLHPVISEIVYKELKPDSVNCRNLVQYLDSDYAKYFYLNWKFKNDTDDEAEADDEKYDLGDMLKLACERITDETEVTAELHSSCAIVYFLLGQYAVAYKLLISTLSMAKGILNIDPEVIADIYNLLGEVCIGMGEFSEALGYLDTALSIYQGLEDDEGCYQAQAYIYNKMSLICTSMMMFDKATEYKDKSAELTKKARSEDESVFLPGMDYTSFMQAEISNREGEHHLLMGDYDKAYTCFARAYKIYKKDKNEDRIEMVQTLIGLGQANLNRGNKRQAWACLGLALKLNRKYFGENHPRTAQNYVLIGYVFIAYDKFDDALNYFEKALDIQQLNYPEEHPDFAITFNAISLVHLLLEDYAKAIEYAEISLKKGRMSLGETHPVVAEAYVWIGEAQKKIGENVKAQKNLNIALKIYTEINPEHPMIEEIKDSLKM